MINAGTRALLTQTAENYGIPIPDYVADAQELVDAATAYRLELTQMTEPSIGAVTPLTISATVDGILAYDQRDRRLELARRIETEATTRLDAAFGRFRGVLLTALAEPYDHAAVMFMDAYDTHTEPAPWTVATLADLIRVRDALAGRVGEGLPGNGYDLPTRIATYPDHHSILNRQRLRTEGMSRGSRQWLDALLSIPGVRLKWQTPSEQAAHIEALPADIGKPTTGEAA